MRKERVLAPGVLPSRTGLRWCGPAELRSGLKSCAGPDNPAPPARIQILAAALGDTPQLGRMRSDEGPFVNGSGAPSLTADHAACPEAGRPAAL